MTTSPMCLIDSFELDMNHERRKLIFWKVTLANLVAYAGFRKDGGWGRKFRKFENNKDQNEKFSTQNQSSSPVQNQMKTKKKGLHSNLAYFLAQN